MNQKLAKKLRKLAEQMATEPLIYSERDQYAYQWGKGLDGTDQLQKVKTQGTITVNEQSARGLYKKFKKDVRAHQLSKKHTQD